MKVLVTGSCGHLGEALVRTLRGLGHEIVGLDMLSGPYTTCVGSVTDRASVRHAPTRRLILLSQVLELLALCGVARETPQSEPFNGVPAFRCFLPRRYRAREGLRGVTGVRGG